MKITWGLFFWPYWLMVVSISLLSAELYALFTNAHNTLSDYAWGELHVYGGEHILLHSVTWWISLIVVVLAMGILVFHIWFKAL